MRTAPFRAGVAEPFVELLTGSTSMAEARGDRVPVSIGF